MAIRQGKGFVKQTEKFAKGKILKKCLATRQRPAQVRLA